MEDDVALVEERTDALLGELDPRTASSEEVRGRQFDQGLAWISFPEGSGGLGLRPDLQRIVDRRLSAAGARPPGAREFFGLTMAGPTVVSHGSDEVKGAPPPASLHRRGRLVPAVQRAGCGLRSRRTRHDGRP